ncbi:hypothetical protein L9F63_028283 [Diploptera punctata]|uniref:Uncharacterized protein n=1 Tax=Diploptera punctata TaxID=6984 RepID=A0AAD8EBD7_DIPPU|nr:hypothetical protein L9F63_021829 [Diploptera punctata]KAJ9587465.1 hypothetical protein L9F63_028283 [Diploptera punctata]
MPLERQIERRTLSCQTGNELLQYLLQSYVRRISEDQVEVVTQWAELNPRALLESLSTTRLRKTKHPGTPHILEESASEHSDDDSGQLKNITISLGDCDCISQRSDVSSHSPISWSHNSDSAV